MSDTLQFVNDIISYHKLILYDKNIDIKTDTNKDKIVKLNELSDYVSKNVKEQAALNGREQIPQLKSNQDKVLVKFN